MERFHSAKDDLVEAYDAIMELQGLVELQPARNKVSVKLIIFMYKWFSLMPCKIKTKMICLFYKFQFIYIFGLINIAAFLPEKNYRKNATSSLFNREYLFDFRWH